jgi:PST family polysaccharide transporter
MKNTHDSAHAQKRLHRNLFSLGLLQMANYILPLMTLPYLVRVLHAERYGLVVFAQAFVQYFGIIVDYGFGAHAPKAISIVQEDKKEVSKIFNAVIYTKLALLCVSFVIMAGIVFSFARFRPEWPLYLASFAIIVSQAISPIWFFQGIEEMRYITILNLAARLIFTLAIFVFVHKEADYLLVPWLTALGGFAAAYAGLHIAWHKFGIRLSKVDIVQCWSHTRQAGILFASNVSVSLFNNFNTVIVGLLAGNKAVALYAAGEKIYKALVNMIGFSTTALYPYLAKANSKSPELFYAELRKYVKLLMIVALMGTAGTYIFAPLAVKILYGPAMQPVQNVLRIFSVMYPLFVINAIFFTMFFLVRGMNRQFFYVTFIGGVCNVVFATLLSLKFAYLGVAVSVVLTELSLSCSYIYFFRKEWKARPGVQADV